MTTHLNLLPIGFLRARLVRRRLALWSPVWAAIAALGAVNWWSSYTQCDAAARALEARERRYAPVQRMLAEISATRTRIEELNNRETMLGELSEPRPPLSGLALVGGGVAECQGRVRVNRFFLERRAGAAAPVGKRSVPVAQEPASAGRSMLTLEGTGVDNVAVATFVEALRETEAFTRVELKSTNRSGEDAGAVRQFVVTCEY
jgi:hypothetical protein